MIILNKKQLYLTIIELLNSYKKEKIFNKLSYKSFERFYEKNTIFIVENKQKIIGFCLWFQRKNWIYINRLCVKQENHKTGCGSHIINNMKLMSPTLRLNVGKKNKKAIEFYLKHGFYFLNKTKEDKYKSIASYSMEWKIINE